MISFRQGLHVVVDLTFRRRGVGADVVDDVLRQDEDVAMPRFKVLRLLRQRLEAKDGANVFLDRPTRDDSLKKWVRRKKKTPTPKNRLS